MTCVVGAFSEDVSSVVCETVVGACSTPTFVSLLCSACRRVCLRYLGSASCVLTSCACSAGEWGSPSALCGEAI